MTLPQLEHIVRAAGAITDENPILVLGSQSILARFPNPPPPLGYSMEADVCPLNAPEKADQISGAIGEITLFQTSHGYYAHGLPPDACPLPAGWRDRLVAHSSDNTRGYTAMCLHPDDLACSKLAAGHEKDLEFVAVMLSHGMVQLPRIEELIRQLPMAAHRTAAERNLTVVRHRVRG